MRTPSLLDRLRSLDPIIVGATAFLLIVGLAILMSATGPIAFQRWQDSLHMVKRQLVLGVFPGILAFLLFSLIDFRIWKRLAVFGFIGSLVLLLAVYTPLGVRVGGSLSWLNIAGIQFQPSEFVKFGLLLYFAAWLSSRTAKQVKDLHEGLLPFIGSLGAIVLLLIVQPDTGSMVVIAGMSGMMYLLSGAPLWWFGALGTSGVGLVWLLIKTSEYRAARFMTFLHPELDPQGIGYHINQAMLAIGSGGWFGLGYGKSRQKFLYLPAVESDSIFAVMAEELGLIFCSVVLAVIGVLVWRCFQISKQSNDSFAKYLSAGVGIWIALQTVINIFSMLGLMPMTGVTLPFISYGGTSLTVLLAAIGLVASLPRNASSRGVDLLKKRL
ncbi:MAG TPA: putative lipid II flippase FtsW [bacterium]|nr:putative lipid II flippase FtsW [Candidatus Magasanikbacteria bacterium]USN52828.1 MAG: putative lipid II flippase FtsW [Candidatus Nomurabacteria bacterium]HPF95348.1 putative lipid II flippase FtsW [bacterium]